MNIVGKLRKKSKSPSILSNDPELIPTIKTGNIGWNGLKKHEKELSFTPVINMAIAYMHSGTKSHTFQEVGSARIHNCCGTLVEGILHGMNDGTVLYERVIIPKNPLYENDYQGDKVAFTGNFKVVKRGYELLLSICTDDDVKKMLPLTDEEQDEIKELM